MRKSSLRGSNGRTISNKIVESQPKPVMKIGEIGGVGSISGGIGTSGAAPKQQTTQVNTNFNQGGSVSNTAPVTTGGTAPKVNQTLVSGFNTQTTNPTSAFGTSTGGVTNNLALNNTSDAASSIANKNAFMAQGISGPTYNQPTLTTQTSTKNDKKPLFDKKTGKSEGGSAPAKGFVGLGGQVTSPDAAGVITPDGGKNDDSSDKWSKDSGAYGESPVEYGYKEVAQGPGIVNERPTIILLAEYKKLYDPQGKKTYVGEHFTKQLDSRLLRQNVINKIFSSQIDSTLPQDLRKNFDRGVSIAYDDVLLIFDIISKMKDLKDKLNFKSSSYSVSGTNVIAQVLNKIGYSNQNLKLYSSTKLFYQLLIELKKTVIYSSYVPATNKKIPSNEDKIVKDISEELFFPVEYGFNGKTTNDISTMDDLLSIGITECYQAIDSFLTQQFIKNIDDLKNSFLISGEDFCALAISIMCKDYKCRAAEKDQGFVQFLSKTYNYAPTLNTNFLRNIIDNAIGNFGKFTFDNPNNISNSLVKLSNFTDNVRTFETDYYNHTTYNGSQKDELQIPGGVYYVDSILNGNLQSFVTNLNSLSKQFKEKSQNIRKVFDSLALTVNSSYQGAGFDPGDPLQVYHIILDQFYSKLTDGTYLLKDSYKDDPFLFLLTNSNLGSPSQYQSLRSNLVQFIFYCVTGDSNKAKLVLDTIMSIAIQNFSIKWGGSDDTDKGPDYADKIESLDNEWWAKKKSEKIAGKDVIWISGDEFYSKLYNMISADTVTDGQASKLGISIIGLLKVFVYGNVTSSAKFMGDASKFCIFCKIIFQMLIMSADYQINELWTKSNISFGDKSVTEVVDNGTTTIGITDPETGQKLVFDPVMGTWVPVPPPKTKTTGGVTTGTNVNKLEDIVPTYDTTQNFFSKLQLSIISSNVNLQTIKNFIISVESKIKKEIQIINDFVNTTTKVLDTITKSIDDLNAKINSTSFKILLKHVDLIAQSSQINTSNNAEITTDDYQLMPTDSKSNAVNEFGDPSAGFNAPGFNAPGFNAPGGAAPNEFSNVGFVNLNFLTKKQISLIANTVMDIKTKITNDSKIKSGDYVHPLDDVLSDKNISDTFHKFFESNFVDSNSRYKILSVGIPNGFSDQMYYKPLAKKNNTPKQNDVISVDVYKIDVLNPDIVYKPQSFLFETSRYVVTDSFYYKGGIEDNLNNQQSKIKFLNNFPTRNFDNLVMSELGKIQYYDDVKTNSSYSFLTNEQKIDMYYNHVVSYLYEIYLKVLTGISLAEKDFYAKDTMKYLDDNVISTIKNTAISVPAVDKYNMLGLAIEEISRNLTSISSPGRMLHNIFIARKFERVFNIIIDPNNFFIDVEKTTKTQQGKDAFDFAVTQKNIIKDKSTENYLPRRLNMTDVTMDRFFVQIKTMNSEEVV